jgi:hypothetical protein
MISPSLAAALADLPTERIQRLVDAIEGDATIKLTVGAWLPGCPMVVAGFDPQHGFALECPERRFAAAWDRFAKTERRRLWHPGFVPIARFARRADVQALLRAANGMLAARQETAHAKQRSLTSTILPASIMPPTSTRDLGHS